MGTDSVLMAILGLEGAWRAHFSILALVLTAKLIQRVNQMHLDPIRKVCAYGAFGIGGAAARPGSC